MTQQSSSASRCHRLSWIEITVLLFQKCTHPSMLNSSWLPIKWETSRKMFYFLETKAGSIYGLSTSFRLSSVSPGTQAGPRRQLSTMLNLPGPPAPVIFIYSTPHGMRLYYDLRRISGNIKLDSWSSVSVFPVQNLKNDIRRRYCSAHWKDKPA